MQGAAVCGTARIALPVCLLCGMLVQGYTSMTALQCDAV